jgi:hypothetical protein
MLKMLLEIIFTTTCAIISLLFHTLPNIMIFPAVKKVNHRIKDYARNMYFKINIKNGTNAIAPFFNKLENKY